MIGLPKINIGDIVEFIEQDGITRRSGKVLTIAQKGCYQIRVSTTGLVWLVHFTDITKLIRRAGEDNSYQAYDHAMQGI